VINLVDPTLLTRAAPKAITKKEIDERRELQIFSMLDYQPFYNHYVQDVLKLNQDVTQTLNAKGMELPLRVVSDLVIRTSKTSSRTTDRCSTRPTKDSIS
jgi:hypothetical protein